MAIIPALKRRKFSPPASTVQGSPPTTLEIRPDEPALDDFYTSAARWNLEQRYEQLPRKQKRKEEENKRLPIKTAEGRIEQLHVPEEAGGNDDSWLQSEDESTQDETSSAVIQKKVEIPLRQQILETKEELAKIASLINQDPEEHTGSFRALAKIAANSNLTIKKLALVTQLAVFKDIIPGYRIRPISEIDQTEKVSKDVRQLRAFEQALVNSYLAYIKDLAQYAKSDNGGHSDSVASLTAVAISCTCALLHAVPHFNFRGELLNILVVKLSSRKIDTSFIECREAIEHLFRNDEDGTSSLDAVSLITKMMKAHNYRVDESVLNTFLHLRLLTEFSSKASQNRVDENGAGGKKPKFRKEFRTKKMRKTLKEQKKVEAEFKEADAIMSHEHRDRMQAETLKLVFVTYFRILKARMSTLMGAVLEGLAKYAHLINQDFFGDLLEALRDLISNAKSSLDLAQNGQAEEEDSSMDQMQNRISPREALLCITTAFALLEGQDAAKSAASLSLDLTFFTSYLYKSLYDVSLNPELEYSARTLRLPDPHSQPTPSPTTTAPKVNLQTTMVLLLRALTSILTPRSVPPVRLAAFTKQLFTASLNLPEKSTLATLGLLNTTGKLHGRKIAALWNTEERKGDGVFNALSGDLESSNPFASTIWEGELLKLHFAPGVREGVKGIEKHLRSIG